MAYKNSFTTNNTNYFKKIHHQLFNNQSLELSSSSKVENIIQEEEAIFKKNHTEGLPDVFKLIESALSKRQRDQRKHSFLERKKYYIKRKMDSLWKPRISHHFMDQAMKQIHSSFSKNIFSYLKMFSMQCRKSSTVEDNKKEWICLTL